MSAESESDVSGPVAMISGPSPSGYPRHLAADDLDQRMRRDRVGDSRREPLAIDGQRSAGRDARLIGGAHDDRAEPPHLLFEQADGVIELVAAEGVAADELGELVGLVDGRRPHRPHLVENDPYAGGGGLPGCLAAGQPAADDGDVGHRIRATCYVLRAVCQ